MRVGKNAERSVNRYAVRWLAEQARHSRKEILWKCLKVGHRTCRSKWRLKSVFILSLNRVIRVPSPPPVARVTASGRS